jgi:hypothetical protein
MELVLGLGSAIVEDTAGSDPPRFIRGDCITKASDWLDEGSSGI